MAFRHTNKALRWILWVLGFAFIAVGIAGIVLPVLPTTPFLLLAAACFARSSEKCYNWLLEHPVLGNSVREWREHGCIPRRTKWLAIIVMATTLAISIVFFAPTPALRIALTILGIGLAVYLYRIPSRS